MSCRPAVSLQSRSSTHSMPPGPLHTHGSSTSLNDFDHTPGSRPRPFDCGDRLSQGSLEGYWDYPQQKPHPEHFGRNPYNYLPPGGPHMGPPGGPPMGPLGGPPHGGPYNYEGDYLESSHERQSRSMLRGGRAHSEDFSPSPGIYHHSLWRGSMLYCLFSIQVLRWTTDTSLLPTGMDQCSMDLHYRGTLDVPQAKCPHHIPLAPQAKCPHPIPLAPQAKCSHHIPLAPQGAGCTLQGLIQCMSFGLFNSAQLHPLIPRLQVSIPCHPVPLLTRPLHPHHLHPMAP